MARKIARETNSAANKPYRYRLKSNDGLPVTTCSKSFLWISLTAIQRPSSPIKNPKPPSAILVASESEHDSPKRPVVCRSLQTAYVSRIDPTPNPGDNDGDPAQDPPPPLVQTKRGVEEELFRRAFQQGCTFRCSFRHNFFLLLSGRLVSLGIEWLVCKKYTVRLGAIGTHHGTPEFSLCIVKGLGIA